MIPSLSSIYERSDFSNIKKKTSETVKYIVIRVGIYFIGRV